MSSTSEENGNRSSYDVTKVKLKNDTQRGYWSSEIDFYFATFGHVIGIVSIILVPTAIAKIGGGLSLLWSIPVMFFGVAPLYFVQGILGQFSRSGYITALRISPIFKGLGYAVVIFNMISSTINGYLAASILIYFFGSFMPKLPWMHCRNSWNTNNCTKLQLQGKKIGNPQKMFISSYQFYSEFIDTDYAISWPVVGCQLIVWALVFFIVSGGWKSIRRIARYFFLGSFSLLFILFLRLAFLPRAWTGVGNVLRPNQDFPFTYVMFSTLISPAGCFLTLGSGWGVVSTLSSYNKFRTNIQRYALVVPTVLLLFGFIFLIFYGFIVGYASELLNGDYNLLEVIMPFSDLAFILGSLKLPQLWSVMFYFSLFLLELNSVVMQIFVSTTALADELGSFRSRKNLYTGGICCLLFLFSLRYAGKYSYFFFDNMLDMSFLAQTLLTFIELMVIVWAYGKSRFLNDVSFLLDSAFAKWKFFIIRYVTPTFPITTLLYYGSAGFFAYGFLVSSTFWIFVIALLIVPMYAINKYCKTEGSCRDKIKAGCTPEDWYPSGDEDIKAKYLQGLSGNPEIDEEQIEVFQAKEADV